MQKDLFALSEILIDVWDMKRTKTKEVRNTEREGMKKKKRLLWSYQE